MTPDALRVADKKTPTEIKGYRDNDMDRGTVIMKWIGTETNRGTQIRCAHLGEDPTSMLGSTVHMRGKTAEAQSSGVDRSGTRIGTYKQESRTHIRGRLQRRTIVWYTAEGRALAYLSKNLVRTLGERLQWRKIEG